MSSSERINSSVIDRILVKSIDTKVSLKPSEEKSISFMLVALNNDKGHLELIDKYRDISNVEK